MSATFKFMILSPGGKAFEGQAEYVRAPGVLGGFGIMAGHAPMIAAVEPGVCAVKNANNEQLFFTGEGIVDISRAEAVMLVDEAKAVADLAEAKQCISERRQRLGGRTSG